MRARRPLSRNSIDILTIMFADMAQLMAQIGRCGAAKDQYRSPIDFLFFKHGSIIADRSIKNVRHMQSWATRRDLSVSSILVPII